MTSTRPLLVRPQYPIRDNNVSVSCWASEHTKLPPTSRPCQPLPFNRTILHQRGLLNGLLRPQSRAIIRTEAPSVRLPVRRDGNTVVDASSYESHILQARDRRWARQNPRFASVVEDEAFRGEGGQGHAGLRGVASAPAEDVSSRRESEGVMVPARKGRDRAVFAASMRTERFHRLRLRHNERARVLFAILTGRFGRNARLREIVQAPGVDVACGGESEAVELASGDGCDLTFALCSRDADQAGV
jgi:hypothetical protein